MDKILVLLYIPILEEEYDIMIPINQKIGVMKQNIISAINEINGFSCLDNTTKLYDKDTFVNYDNDIYVKDSGIKNGSKLILI